MLVTVHSDDRYVVDRASEILERKHPVSMDRYGGGGRALELVGQAIKAKIPQVKQE